MCGSRWGVLVIPCFQVALKQDWSRSQAARPAGLPIPPSFPVHLTSPTCPRGDWEEDACGVPSLDELLPPTFQSEEDKQLQDELEMLVERLGVSHDMLTRAGACLQLSHLFALFPSESNAMRGRGKDGLC